MVLVFEEIDDAGCPCLASGLGGVIVPEQLDITEVCQDPDNLNIVYVKATVQGIYDYVPEVTVSYTLNGQSKSVNVTNRFIPGWNSIGVVSFPIITNCSAVTIILAYDIGSMIPNFETIESIDFSIVFKGELGANNFSTLIKNTNVFVSTDPSATVTYGKGVTPKPYKMFFDPNSNKLKIQYSNLGSNPCPCAINCVTPSEEEFGLTICTDEIQEINVDATNIFGDPTNVLVTFLDPVGNKTNFSIESMINVVPHKLSALEQSNPPRIEVALFYMSVNMTRITASKVQYQIWKYKGNPDSAEIWKDWSNENWSTFYDQDIETASEYGYAVRFKGEFGELSEFSDWTVKQAI